MPHPPSRRTLGADGKDYRANYMHGVVTLSEIGPVWTINQQAKSLKSLAPTLVVVPKFRSVGLNVTTPTRLLDAGTSVPVYLIREKFTRGIDLCGGNSRNVFDTLGDISEH